MAIPKITKNYKPMPFIKLDAGLGAGFVRHIRVMHPDNQKRAESLMETLDTFIRLEYPKQFIRQVEEFGDCIVHLLFSSSYSVTYENGEWTCKE